MTSFDVFLLCAGAVAVVCVLTSWEALMEDVREEDEDED